MSTFKVIVGRKPEDEGLVMHIVAQDWKAARQSLTDQLGEVLIFNWAEVTGEDDPVSQVAAEITEITAADITDRRASFSDITRANTPNLYLRSLKAQAMAATAPQATLDMETYAYMLKGMVGTAEDAIGEDVDGVRAALLYTLAIRWAEKERASEHLADVMARGI
jgi:hypothetical protein